jgi:hypothetical protein
MQIGKTFRTREGELVTVIEITSDKTHPIVCLDSRRRMHKYTNSGRYISDSVNHKKDFVSEH